MAIDAVFFRATLCKHCETANWGAAFAFHIQSRKRPSRQSSRGDRRIPPSPNKSHAMESMHTNIPSGKKPMPQSGRLWDFLKVEMGFVKEFACSPFLVGSICPSSRMLAAQLVGMAQNAACSAPATGAAANAAGGLVIDLGAGPGPVTGELLRAGISPDRIVAVERSPAFAAAFKRRYRQVPILTGDAADLRRMLAEHFPDAPISAVISSLPFRSIPRKIAANILWELNAALAERGGVLVQYSYIWWMKHALGAHGFKPVQSRLVIQNVPPARVESYVVEPEFRPKLML